MIHREWDNNHIFLLSKKLAWKIASRDNKSGSTNNIEVDELTQDIAERLLKARKRYDSSRGSSITAHMYNQANYAIKDSYRGGFAVSKYRIKNGVRVYAATEYDTTESLSENFMDSDGDIRYLHALQKAATVDKLEFIDKDMVESLMQQLNEREQRIIKWFFVDDMTIQEIADREGCHASRIWQIRERALLKCHNYLQNAA